MDDFQERLNEINQKQQAKSVEYGWQRQPTGPGAPLTRSHEHIDVRGVWPVYVNGQWAKEMVGAPRGLTIEQAREWKPEDSRWAITDYPRVIQEGEDDGIVRN